MPLIDLRAPPQVKMTYFLIFFTFSTRFCVFAVFVFAFLRFCRFCQFLHFRPAPQLLLCQPEPLWHLMDQLCRSATAAAEVTGMRETTSKICVFRNLVSTQISEVAFEKG